MGIECIGFLCAGIAVRSGNMICIMYLWSLVFSIVTMLTSFYFRTRNKIPEWLFLFSIYVSVIVVVISMMMIDCYESEVLKYLEKLL